MLLTAMAGRAILPAIFSHAGSPMRAPLPALLPCLCALTLLACGQDAKPAKPAAKKPAAKKAPKKAEATKKADAPKKAEAPKPAVNFVFPSDGAKVFSPFTVVFGVQGMGVLPAGQAVDDKSKGHHHIIIDGKPIPAGTVVPMDATHKHYGKGQTEAQLELPHGKHTLTMQFADGAHRSYGPALSKTINVEVVGADAKPRVWFVEPADGAKVASPVIVKFGVEGMSLRPAGEDPLDHTSGHHHIVVDGKPLKAGQVVPKDAKNIHYGKAQTEGKVSLLPGKHTLTMQLADGAHRSYGEGLSTTISIVVE